MTDDEVAALLRSDEPVVTIEAPAGCGKTHQGASYARDTALELNTGKVLILTHTHAACAVFAERTDDLKSKVDIRTIDSLVAQIASIYHKSLDLPEDVSAWTRQQDGGFEMVAEKVARLLKQNPMLCKHLVRLFPVVICDEHQDSNVHQHAIVEQICAQGGKLRILGDPMQMIYLTGRRQAEIDAEIERWESIKNLGSLGELETPHRWRETAPELGEWILGARQQLKDGNPIDLTDNLPDSVVIISAENVAVRGAPYRLDVNERQPIDQVVGEASPALILAGQNATVKALRSGFNRRFPIWEGHTRSALEQFIDACAEADGDASVLCDAFHSFLGSVLVGFTTAKFGNRLKQEIDENCVNNARGNVPPQLQIMARMILENPDHIGIANATGHLVSLIEQPAPGFADIKIDLRRELSDLIKLRHYEDPHTGLLEIARKRSYARPMPPEKCLSTVHKAKGLESHGVVLMACDRTHFSDTYRKRCLLYVAMSRATHRLTLVVSTQNQSPLVSL